MQVRLLNPMGIVVERPTGVSWTTLFFGPFPAMFRADWKYAFIIIIFCSITDGFAIFLFMFKYNKWHLNRLLAKGYKPADSESRLELINIGVISSAKEFDD